MIYAIHAQVGTKGIPTFHLDSTLRGIADAEQAADVARTVVNPLGTIPESDLRITVYATRREH